MQPATTVFRLDNGLTVVLQENHVASVVTFQAWVGVGSADEPDDLAGVAHVFEHMLFKGTARRGVGEIAREVESSGGDINAWTSFDETVFHLVLASRHFDAGLDILTDALRRSSFDAAELERELKVVLEEVRQGEDSPGRVASRHLFATAFTSHPYRRPVIGYTHTVEKFKREQLLEFFHRHYVPSNITLVVVGDFDSAAARRKIEEQWRDAPSTARHQMPPRPVEPEQRAPRASVITSNVSEAHVAIALHVPPLMSDDTPALDLGALILGQGDSSRLVREVRRNRQLVTEAGAYSYSPRDPGLLVASATLPGEQLEAAVDAMLDEMLRLAREEVGGDELDKAKAIIESDGVYQKETVQGQARKLGFYQTVAGSLEQEEAYNRQVRDVTPRALRAVMARYMRRENCTVTALLPSSGTTDKEAVERRLLERVDAAWARADQRWGQPRAEAASATVVREVLPSGVRVIVQRDPSVPLVSIRAAWLGGLRAEDERNNGVNNLLAALITRGTRTRTGDELAHEIEAMAGSIGGFSGRNSFGIRAELLARHWEKGLDILLDCLSNPAFRDEDIEKERRHVLEELRTQEDNPTTVAFRVFAQALYPRHPFRLDMLGTPESVASLTRRRITDYYRRHFPFSAMTIAVVGDVEPAAVIARLRAAIERSDRGAEAHAPSPPPPDPPPAEPRRAERLLDKQQAHIVVGFPGTTVAHADRFVLEVMATILSGQGGRLFVELRDKRGLAYRVSAFSVEGVDPGYFAVYMATGPGNLEAAEVGIRDELNKVIDRPVSQAELDRAKRYLVGAHDISLQRRSALAATIAFGECYGTGWDVHLRYAAGIEAVRVEDVQRAARQYLDPRRAVVAIVRPGAAAQPPASRAARKKR